VSGFQQSSLCCDKLFVGQRSARVHIVQRRHRRDEIERLVLVWVLEEISEQVFDALRADLLPGLFDARLIGVDARDVRYAKRHLAGEHAFTAADIQRPLSPRRDRPKKRRIIVDAVVPASSRPGHDHDCSRRRPRSR
jgi:hypothetical protein